MNFLSINIFSFSIILTFFGFLMGSFLNLVSIRVNTGKSLSGRSMCLSCSKKLEWYELIPIFSWIIQKGRCRKCHSKISYELILSEIVSGIFFGFIALRGLFSDNFILNTQYIIATFYLIFIMSLLLIIVFYDIRHKIILDKFILFFSILSFVGLFFFGFSYGVYTYIGFHFENIWNIIAGIIVPLPFIFIWFLSKGKMIGFGDIKLMSGMGLLFGVRMGFSSLFISFWIGALFSLSIIIIRNIFKRNLNIDYKNSIMNKEIPFAPFLVLGIAITFIFNVNVLPI